MAKKVTPPSVTENPIESVNQQMKDEIIEFILNGYSRTEIAEYLELNYNINRENAFRYYRLAHISIMEIGDFDIEIIVTQHFFYYEEAIRYFDSVGNFNAKAIAMNAKEKLLKVFEDDELLIEVENNINIEVEQMDYDISKL